MVRIVCPHCGKSFTMAEAKKGKIPATDTEELLKKAAAEMKAALSARELQLKEDLEEIGTRWDELKVMAVGGVDKNEITEELEYLSSMSMCLRAEIASVQARLAEMEKTI